MLELNRVIRIKQKCTLKDKKSKTRKLDIKDFFSLAHEEEKGNNNTPEGIKKNDARKKIPYL